MQKIQKIKHRISISDVCVNIFLPSCSPTYFSLCDMPTHERVSDYSAWMSRLANPGQTYQHP